MSIFKDQTGREVFLPKIPERIVSLVPSQTEFLFDLGLHEKIVGITNYCVHPKELCKRTKKIGGTKDFDIQKILALKPDLIIANKEENFKEGIEALEKHFPVWVSDIFSLEDSFEMMLSVGRMTGKEEEAKNITASIRHEFDRLKNLSPPPRKMLYFIWKDPYMIAAQNTFIAHMAEKINLYTLGSERYPIIDENDIKNYAPDLILLSSEPYPFREKHKEKFAEWLPQAKIFIVDGEMFSWYGSRLKFSARYFEGLLHNIEAVS